MTIQRPNCTTTLRQGSVSIAQYKASGEASHAGAVNPIVRGELVALAGVLAVA
jgi:hypothetical protein